MRKKFAWGRLNGPGLRSHSTPLRTAKPPEPEYERAGKPIYSSNRWKVLRNELRKEKPYCEHCGVTAKQKRLMVDHIKEIRDGGAPFDKANLQVLCDSCHASKTQKERMKRGGRS
jgi:5-methylcytosine-specific restriction endonuclease McrA